MPAKYEQFLDRNKKVKLEATENGEMRISANGNVLSISDAGLEFGSAADGGTLAPLGSGGGGGSIEEGSNISVNIVTQVGAKFGADPVAAGTVVSVEAAPIPGEVYLGDNFKFQGILNGLAYIYIYPQWFNDFSTPESLVGRDITILKEDFYGGFEESAFRVSSYEVLAEIVNPMDMSVIPEGTVRYEVQFPDGYTWIDGDSEFGWFIDEFRDKRMIGDNYYWSDAKADAFTPGQRLQLSESISPSSDTTYLASITAESPLVVKPKDLVGAYDINEAELYGMCCGYLRVMNLDNLPELESTMELRYSFGGEDIVTTVRVGYIFDDDWGDGQSEASIEFDVLTSSNEAVQNDTPSSIGQYITNVILNVANAVKVIDIDNTDNLTSLLVDTIDVLLPTEAVYLHQSEFSVKTKDINGEDKTVISYDVADNKFTSLLPSTFDKYGDGNIAMAHIAEGFTVDDRNNVVAANNLDRQDGYLQGSVIIGDYHSIPGAEDSVAIGMAYNSSAVLKDTVKIGNSLFNWSSASDSAGNVIIGNNIQESSIVNSDSQTNFRAYSSESVMIGTRLYSKAKNTVGIGRDLTLGDVGATSINSRNQFTYSMGGGSLLGPNELRILPKTAGQRTLPLRPVTTLLDNPYDNFTEYMFDWSRINNGTGFSEYNSAIIKVYGAVYESTLGNFTYLESRFECQYDGGEGTFISNAFPVMSNDPYNTMVLEFAPITNRKFAIGIRNVDGSSSLNILRSNFKVEIIYL